MPLECLSLSPVTVNLRGSGHAEKWVSANFEVEVIGIIKQNKRRKNRAAIFGINRIRILDKHLFSQRPKVVHLSKYCSAVNGERVNLTKPVDVVILTKNSERLLRRCIDSVYQNVPVNRLIVVDGYSIDNTLQILEEFQERHGNVVLVQDRGTRGSARQVAINKVKTDWFMFVDSDVVLSRNWFAEAEKLIRGDVGAIWGVEIWSVLRRAKILGLFERVTLKIFEKRGALHDLLVRRKAVDGIAVPYNLHTYEDAYIKSWIVGKGYKVIGVYEPYCLHFRSTRVWTLRHFSFMGEDLKFAARHPLLLLPYMFHTIVEICLTVLYRCRHVN